MKLRKLTLSSIAVLLTIAGYPLANINNLQAVELEEPITLKVIDGMAVRIAWKQPVNKKKHEIAYYLMRCSEPNGNYEEVAKLQESTTKYIDVLDKEGTYYYKLIVSTNGKKEAEDRVSPVAVAVEKTDNIKANKEEATEYLQDKIDNQVSKFTIVYPENTDGHFIKSDDNVTIKAETKKLYKKDKKQWYQISYNISYEMTKEEVEESNALLQNLMETTFKDISTATSAEKVEAVYKYLATHTILDEDKTTIYTVLKNNKGDSQSIAKTAQKLFELLNIESRIVSNGTIYWNLCQMADGSWYDVDITMEIQSIEQYEYIRYDYLLTNRFKAHETDEHSELPMGSEPWKFNKIEPKNISAYTTDEGFRITWDIVDHASGYQVQRATSRDGTYSDVISYAGQRQEERGLTDTNEILDVNAKPGQTYYYRVKAFSYNKGVKDEGVYSDAYKITYLGKTRLTINTSSISPYLSWDAVDGASNYVIYRKEAGNPEEKIAVVNNTCFVDKSAKADTNYSYRIQIANRTASSELYEYYSNYVTTYGIKDLEHIDEGVKITIKSKNPEDKFRVYSYNESKKAFAYIGNAEGNEFVDVRANKEGNQYEYMIAPYVENEEGRDINIKSIPRTIAIMKTPEIAGTIMNEIPVITWELVPDAVSYHVYIKDESGNDVLYGEYGCSENTAYLLDKKGTHLEVKVRAVSAFGTKSKFSTILRI